LFLILILKMFKQLLKSLFLTFITSILVSTAAVSVFYAITQKTNDYSHVVSLIISGTFFLNCILFIMSLPALFLYNPDLWNKLVMRVILYFSGAIVFIITSLLLNLQGNDKVVYLSIGVIYLLTHAIFYYKLIKRRA
jgi:hypothetical protein